MASYQDIDVRLVGVENALKFLMETMQVKLQINSPLAPAPQIQQMSMFDFWRMQMNQGILEKAAQDVVEEKNGTDSEPEPDVTLTVE